MRKSTARKMKAEREAYIANQRRLEREAQPMFLSAKNLLLPNVPESVREDIRTFLAPFVSKVSCQRREDGSGDCWNIAQQLMLATDNLRVNYVEGVYDSGIPCTQFTCLAGWTRILSPRIHTS